MVINPFNPSRAARNLTTGCGRRKCYIETEETSVKVATRNIEVSSKAICTSFKKNTFRLKGKSDKLSTGCLQYK